MGDYEEGFCFKVIAMAGDEEAWIVNTIIIKDLCCRC
jgi:hypothetical protein